MQTQLRYRRDGQTDGRTDRQTAFQLYIVEGRSDGRTDRQTAFQLYIVDLSCMIIVTVCVFTYIISNNTPQLENV